MNDITYFDRLVASAERVARHNWHPGKDRAVEQCIEDVEGLMLEGLINDEQRDVLREILLSGCSNAA